MAGLKAALMGMAASAALLAHTAPALAQGVPDIKDGRTESKGPVSLDIERSTQGSGFMLNIVPRVDASARAELALKRLLEFGQSVSLRVRIDPALIPTPRVLEMVASIAMVDGAGIAIRGGYDIDVAHDLVLGFSGGTAQINAVRQSAEGLVVTALVRDAAGNFVTPPAHSLALYTTGGERLCFDEGEITLRTESSVPLQSGQDASAVPMSFLILLDRSGSMGSVMEEVKSAALGFIDDLPGGATCAVGAFANEGGSYDESEGLGVNECRASNFSLHGVHAGGGTDLFSPLRDAYEWMAMPERADQQRAVIIITDGEANQNLQLAETVRNLKGKTLTFVYFLGGRDDRYLKGLADSYLKHEGAIAETLPRYFEVLSEAYAKQTVLTIKQCEPAQSSAP